MNIDDLAAGKYISLATYKKDGTRVATPVWVTREGDHLYVITEADSGKAKRLRNSSRAQVAPCDMRGTVTGEAVDADAVLLDAAGTNEVRDRVNAKYGLMATLFGLRGKIAGVFGKAPEQVGIQISLQAQ
ncbi:MAG: PPOX class F420-dependent oxidoreductase [Candidatus Nanopelagicales bacterium]|nr:PPOX class F420-dependent oxidoreductase [Actinomycetota bacterium]HNL51202.1 PPOX class F420-dependent oxidoreductase [Actinomycetota bacterium]HNO15264.1 PPOX class F420-dependent oxidoreductase [Actinomycetota bacterium]HUM86603.1 PPOX class F420-dependent oxidoreductase [Actinomycetota bacterium]